MNLEFCKATLNDIAQMQQLVAAEVGKGIILNRNDNEVATNIRSYILAKQGSNVVAFCALHIHNTALAEVRSLVVAESCWGQGIGSRLVQECLKEAARLCVREILALTYEKPFFEKLGFIEVPKNTLPDDKIWTDCIKCKHFPQCNEVSLIKTL